MAATTKVVLGSRISCSLNNVVRCNSTIRNASWSTFFRGSQTDKEVQDKEQKARIRKAGELDGPSTISRLESLKKKTSLCSVRGYKPPYNVSQKVVSVAANVLGMAVEPSFKLDDRLVKFKLLTKLMDEFDHPVPNNELSTLNTIEDVVNFFSTPVQDRSSYENMAKLDLPKNLHIQLEPLRFDPETDTFFDGKTAFTGRPTIVSSLKYSRKFKGNSGQSRNEKSLTEFELHQQLKETYAAIGKKFK